MRSAAAREVRGEAPRRSAATPATVRERMKGENFMAFYRFVLNGQVVSFVRVLAT